MKVSLGICALESLRACADVTKKISNGLSVQVNYDHFSVEERELDLGTYIYTSIPFVSLILTSTRFTIVGLIAWFCYAI